MLLLALAARPHIPSIYEGHMLMERQGQVGVKPPGESLTLYNKQVCVPRQSMRATDSESAGRGASHPAHILPGHKRVALAP